MPLCSKAVLQYIRQGILKLTVALVVATIIVVSCAPHQPVPAIV
jgi:hypothetical protein